MAKIVALDFGLKRTGVAITDDACIFAFALDTWNSESLLDNLVKLVSKEQVGTIVLGLPSRLNQEDAHITENVRMLAEVLKKQFPTCAVEFYDERFTSKMASQVIVNSGLGKMKRQNKSLVDKVSATIILQSYLDSKR